MIKLMKLPNYIIIFCCLLIPSIVISQPIIIHADTTRGCGQLNVNFTYTSTFATPNVFWDFGNGTTSTSDIPPTVSYTPGAYNVKLVINGTDSVINTNYILVGRKPDAVIRHRDTTDRNYLLVNLQAFAVNFDSIKFTPFKYQWEINGTAAGTSQVARHLFDTTGIYPAQVILTDTIGCKDTATLQLIITEKIVVPNVFSPNNDGSNDFFVVSSNERYFLSFQVFTRDGLLVYKTKATTISWDGKMASGTEVPAGIYYYTIDAEESNPHITEKGFLYIFR